MTIAERYHNYNKVNKFYSQNKRSNISYSASTILLTVAFNKPKLIEQQYSLLKKYIEDDFMYIVVDNSTDPEASKSIRNF
jgi:hypothetical protein